MTTIEVIRETSGLQELVAEWNQLALPSPMQTPEWLLAWWDAFQASQDSLHVIAVRDDSRQLIGLAPWYRREGFASGSTLRFLGDGRVCSDFQSILCRPGYESQVLTNLITWLSSDPGARWDLLDLEGVSAGDPFMRQFQIGMQERGHVTHLRETLNTWRISLEGGLSGLQSRLSKTQAAQLRNFINRFEKGNFGLRSSTEEPESTNFFATELMRLHQMHWQSQGQPGCFATAEFRGFFESAMHSMVAKHMAEIMLLEREGKVVAANVWLVRDGIVYGYQMGRDPAEDPNRVGRILQAVLLRHTCQAGLVAYDFLRGDEVYKQQLRAVPTPCQRLRIVAKTRMSELRHSIWATCRDMRALLTGSGST